jgi:protease I
MRLKNKQVLTVVEHEFEDSELIYPHYRLKEEGAVVHIAGREADKEYKGKHGVPVTMHFLYRADGRRINCVVIPKC